MKNFKFVAIALMLVGTLTAFGSKRMKRTTVYSGWAHIYSYVVCNYASLDPIYLVTGGCDPDGFGDVCTIQSQPAYPDVYTCEAYPLVYLRRPY